MHEPKKAGEMETKNWLTLAFFTLFDCRASKYYLKDKKLLSGFRLTGVSD